MHGLPTEQHDFSHRFLTKLSQEIQIRLQPINCLSVSFPRKKLLKTMFKYLASDSQHIFCACSQKTVAVSIKVVNILQMTNEIYIIVRSIIHSASETREWDPLMRFIVVSIAIPDLIRRSSKATTSKYLLIYRPFVSIL